MQTVVRYTVPELSSDVRKLKEARERRKAALDKFQTILFETFDGFRPTWLSVVKILAEVDCLLSLAKSSANLDSPRCRPLFEEQHVASIDFKDLRHPALIVKGDFIPNNVRLGVNAEERIILLTGENTL